MDTPPRLKPTVISELTLVIQWYFY